MLATMDRMAFKLPKNFTFPLLCKAYNDLMDKKVYYLSVSREELISDDCIIHQQVVLGQIEEVDTLYQVELNKFSIALKVPSCNNKLMIKQYVKFLLHTNESEGEMRT